MDHCTRAPEGTEGRIWLELELLRDELAMLRRQLAGEVRTRRLVVVDERGFSRVVIDTLAKSGTVEVRGQTKHGQRFTVSLIASEESDMAFAGVYVREEVEEESVAELEALGPLSGSDHRTPSAHLRLGRPGAPAVHACALTDEAELSVKANEPLSAETEQALVTLWAQRGWNDAEGAGLPQAQVIVAGLERTVLDQDGGPV